jgi:hypothetical protein
MAYRPETYKRWSRTDAGTASRERKKRQYAERRRILDAFKLAEGCADCGYAEYACALDFDHRPGEVKVGGVSSMLAGCSMERVWAEVEKCDVVCANCHRVRTLVERKQHLTGVNG